MDRAVLYLAPAADAAALEAGVRGEVFRADERLAYQAQGLAHAGVHRAALEYGCGDASPADVGELMRADLANLGSLVDPDASVALVGTDHHLVPGGPTSVRFSYHMRRRSDFSHDAYLDRYLNVHAAFGIATPGIEGYTQFHVDVDASAEAASVAGVGVCDVDSISELHLESLDTFFAALTSANSGTEAHEDEQKFVDRDNSWDYVFDRL